MTDMGRVAGEPQPPPAAAPEPPIATARRFRQRRNRGDGGPRQPHQRRRRHQRRRGIVGADRNVARHRRRGVISAGQRRHQQPAAPSSRPGPSSAPGGPSSAPRGPATEISVEQAIALRDHAPEIYDLWLRIAQEKAATASYVERAPYEVPERLAQAGRPRALGALVIVLSFCGYLAWLGGPGRTSAA